MLHMLYGAEEIESSDRDEIGNYEAHHSPRRWDASLYRPVVNEALCGKVSGWLDRIRWPEGKAFAACLTHDLDSVQINSRRELLRTIGSLVRHAKNPGEKLRHCLSVAGLRHRPQNVDLMTPWIEAERKRGFRSTFFVFPTRVRRRHPRDCTYTWSDPTWYRGRRCSVREMLRDVVKLGWGIGLHGSLHSALDADLLREQKEDVEECLGRAIWSTRQHNLRFDVLRTPLAQVRAGFQTDSTLGFNRDIGFRNGIAYPFALKDPSSGEPIGLLEIPLVLHDGALLRKDNLFLGEDSAYRVCRLLIDRVAATKGVITLLWHPNQMDDLRWFQLYEKVLDYIVEKNGWGATPKAIYDWWTGQGLDAELERALQKVSREQ
ncbi:MAG: polysaccharide deacetylase family protein [Verrucomicrobiae bacterium]|nr:polysaccharide deacetylase family protein [Verrucomicrobiae bacterium]